MYQNSAKDIVQFLNSRINEVVKYLLPNGKKKGNEWCVGSVSGEVGESLQICLSGDKVGVWSDFATAEGGDPLNLWCAIRHVDLRTAILETRQWLGITQHQFEPQKRLNWVKPKLKLNALTIGSSVVQYLIELRKLTIETLKAFQITADSDKIIFPYYRDQELIFVKYLNVTRLNGKKDISVTPNSEPCLFGWQCIPKDTRSIVLTEGEIDTMSLFQYGLPFGILSVPFGGGGGGKQNWIENEFDRLNIYDEIYLCLDNDQEGQIATQTLVQRLGRHRCRIVTLPCKDANECLQNNVSVEEIKKCFDLAKILDPDELKRADSFLEQVIQEIYPASDTHLGYTLPWNKTQGRILLAPDELSVWTGINGHGKSQMLGQIILGCIKQGAKLCIASLELKPKRLLARLTRQAAGVRNPTVGYIKAINKWYGENLWIFDLVGTAKTERILEVFLYARQRYGIDVFVIDSMMKCGITEDDYNAQKMFVEKLCDFKNEHNCHIHLVIHPRKLQDESKPPGKLDIKGSGALSDLADNCFTVWRNKAKEEGLKKSVEGTPAHSELLRKYDAILQCDKQRNGEWEGAVTLWFDLDSFQYLEGYKQRPIQMVDYRNPIDPITNISVLDSCVKS